MSALPLKADINRHEWHVSYVSIADNTVSPLYPRKRAYSAPMVCSARDRSWAMRSQS